VFGFLFMLVAALLLAAAVWLVVKRVKAAGSDGLLETGRKIRGPEPAEDDSEEPVAEKTSKDKSREPPISLVLLQRHKITMTREILSARVQHAFGVVLGDEPGCDAFWAAPPMPSIFPMVVRQNLYAITVVQDPYTSDRDWYVDDDSEQGMVSAWQKHRAWLSIDLIASRGGSDAASPMEFIGKLAGELVDDDTLAVVHPAVRHAVAYDPEVRTMLRKRPVREAVKGPLRAFALLRNRPRKLTQAELTQAAHRAWGKRLSEDPTNAACAVVSENGLGFIQIDGIRIGLGAANGRYVPDVKQAAAEIEDLRLRQAFESHTSWWGVDFMEAAVNISKAKAYQMVGRLAAEFIDDGVTMLYAPEYHRATVITENTRQQLRGNDPLEAVFHASRAPLLQVKGDEPAMQKAIAEARRRWPEFAEAFVNRKAGHHFAVKRGFASEKGKDHQEFMWVQVLDIEEDRIIGVLDNDPVYVKNLRAGDRVISQPDDVIDWIFKGDDDLVGNFTGPVILAAQRRGE